MSIWENVVKFNAEGCGGNAPERLVWWVPEGQIVFLSLRVPLSASVFAFELKVWAAALSRSTVSMPEDIAPPIDTGKPVHIIHRFEHVDLITIDEQQVKADSYLWAPACR